MSSLCAWYVGQASCNPASGDGLPLISLDVEHLELVAAGCVLKELLDFVECCGTLDSALDGARVVGVGRHAAPAEHLASNLVSKPSILSWVNQGSCGSGSNSTRCSGSVAGLPAASRKAFQTASSRTPAHGIAGLRRWSRTGRNRLSSGRRCRSPLVLTQPCPQASLKDRTTNRGAPSSIGEPSLWTCRTVALEGGADSRTDRGTPGCSGPPPAESRT
jgi:hypothetical protein